MRLQKSLPVVKQRVQYGGHYVSPEDIVRRWNRSMDNLRKIRSSLDRLYLVDNSGEGHRLVGSFVHKHYRVPMAEEKSGYIRWYVPLMEEFVSELMQEFLGKR